TSSDGRSVVVWEDDSDENGVKQVRMRIFDPTGRTIGNERTVNTYPPGNQGAPRVAMSPNGQYILVAFSDDVTGQTHVRAARYSWNSTSNNYRKDNTEDLEVSVPHANPSGMPSYKHFDVAINDAGRGVVVWEDD